MKINQLKAGVILSYISMFLGYAVSILYTPVMLRILGQNEYGLYSLVASVVSYLGLLNFGIGGAYTRYYLIYKVKNDYKNIARLNAMYFIVFLVIAVIAVIAGLICCFNLGYILGGRFSSDEVNKAKFLFLILVLNIAVSFIATVFNTHITANEKYICQKLVQMIKLVINPFIMLPVLLMGYGSAGMVTVTLILNIAVETFNIIFCVKNLKIQFLFTRFDFSLMKEIIVFSSYLFANMIIDQINWNVGKFIIGRYRGASEVAVYGIAMQLRGYYLSLSTAISSVFVPRINKMAAENNDNNGKSSNSELSRLFTKIGRIQFMILSCICLALIIFGKEFINIWAGSEYNSSYYIALIIIIPATVPSIQNIGVEIQKAMNMHQFRSILYLLIAVCNVCVSIPLIKIYGGVGAALGIAVSLAIGNGLIMNIYYHNKIGLNMKYFWTQIMKITPALLPSVIFGVIIFYCVNLYSIVNFIVFAVLYLLVFCISMWFAGMNSYEKNIIKNPVMVIYSKLKKRRK